MEDAVGRPLRLGDRFIKAPSRQDGLVEGAVGAEGRSSKPGAVPGHVRVIPFQPGEPAAVGGQARRRQEVRADDQDVGRGRPIERDRHDRGPGFAWAAVILANGENHQSSRIEPQVREPPGLVGRDRDGLGVARVQSIQPPVREVGEHDHAARHGVRAAAVFVDPGPHVEWRRGQVGHRPVGRKADEDAPAALGWARLKPVDLVTVEPRLGQADHMTDHVVDPDRGRPRTVRRQHGVGHRDQVPCRQDATYSACSAVIVSRVMPRAASLSRATSASMASGTT